MRNRRSCDLELNIFFNNLKKKVKNNNWYVFIDLNNFKIVNDNFGHSKGDEVLKEFSEILFQNIRSSDLVFRIGGDEFVIFFKRVSKIDLKNILDKIILSFDKINCEEYKLGLSVGVLEFDAENKTTEEIEVLADEAMYEAKKSEKNIVFRK
ncbi:MAG TPA: GGDEF domain-containing protein [Bacteroidia bacterium]|nr:GGDEF domain-containing protein [Bacteroidia bacterium]